jgi:ABC-type antimicrobial peptide transport system permease subunit
VIRQGLRPVTLGLLAALPFSVAAASGLQTMLFGIAPNDPTTLLSAALIVFVTAVAAVALPARQATRIGPMTALRYE